MVSGSVMLWFPGSFLFPRAWEAQKEPGLKMRYLNFNCKLQSLQMIRSEFSTKSCAVERLVGLAWLQVVCENLFSSLFWNQFVLLLFFSESKNFWLSVY